VLQEQLSDLGMPPEAAKCSGVKPSLSLAFTLAPFLRSSLTLAASPVFNSFEELLVQAYTSWMNALLISFESLWNHHFSFASSGKGSLIYKAKIWKSMCICSTLHLLE
jgi:hypothetical protein